MCACGVHVCACCCVVCGCIICWYVLCVGCVRVALLSYVCVVVLCLCLAVLGECMHVIMCVRVLTCVYGCRACQL